MTSEHTKPSPSPSPPGHLALAQSPNLAGPGRATGSPKQHLGAGQRGSPRCCPPSPLPSTGHRTHPWSLHGPGFASREPAAHQHSRFGWTLTRRVLPALKGCRWCPRVDGPDPQQHPRGGWPVLLGCRETGPSKPRSHVSRRCCHHSPPGTRAGSGGLCPPGELRGTPLARPAPSHPGEPAPQRQVMGCCWWGCTSPPLPRQRPRSGVSSFLSPMPEAEPGRGGVRVLHVPPDVAAPQGQTVNSEPRRAPAESLLDTATGGGWGDIPGRPFSLPAQSHQILSHTRHGRKVPSRPLSRVPGVVTLGDLACSGLCSGSAAARPAHTGCGAEGEDA